MNTEFKERTQFLGKWIGVLFWLAILRIPLNINLSLVGMPDFGITLDIVKMLCVAAYCAVLLKLSGEGKRYRDAGLAGIISVGITLFLAVMGAAGVSAVSGSLILSLIGLVFSIVSEYQEYMAHADVLETVAGDPVLAKKWRKLWVMCVWFWIISIFSFLIIAMFGKFGLIITAVGVIGVIAVGILKMVYLYQASKLFKACDHPLTDTEVQAEDSVKILLDPALKERIDAETTEPEEN